MFVVAAINDTAGSDACRYGVCARRMSIKTTTMYWQKPMTYVAASVSGGQELVSNADSSRCVCVCVCFFCACQSARATAIDDKGRLRCVPLRFVPEKDDNQPPPPQLVIERGGGGLSQVVAFIKVGVSNVMQRVN